MTRSYIHFAQPFFGKEEKQEVLKALDSGWVTLGPRVKMFEEKFAKYIGVKHAIAVSSCTAALQLSVIAAGISEGDEVIISPFTFVANANVLVQQGAVPVFADIDPKTFNMDPEKVEEKITKRTRAIMPVHYAGQPVDMDKIMRIAKSYKLKVIEDAAHATGTEYKGKKIGALGNLACFSFHPIKNMSTGDGGMITTKDDKYAEKLMMLRLHGMSKDAWKRHSKAGSWKYDIVYPGYKYNMTDIQAALGMHQLDRLDQFIRIRQNYAKIYDEAFSKIPEITIPYVEKDIRHARNLYTIMVDDRKLGITRDDLVEELKQANIGASVYFIPLHYFTYYKKNLKYKKGDFPIAERIYQKIISLPMYPKMKAADIKYIIEVLISLIKKHRK